MHITPFRALFPDPDLILKDATFFDTAKERYTEFLDAGFYRTLPEDVIFLYEIETPSRRHLGFLACADIADYLNGTIKKHEQTLPVEEQKQMQFILARAAAVKPILLVHQDVPALAALMRNYIVKQPVFFELYFEEEQQTHRWWTLHKILNISELQILFRKNVSSVYIADGHHRMGAMALIAKSTVETTAEKISKFRYSKVYCAFFPASEVEILAFNRIVEIPENFELAHLQHLFEIASLPEAALPTQPHELTLCTPQGWFQLQWKSTILHTQDSKMVADSTLLNENVLKDLFGIEDVRRDPRVEYVASAKSVAIIEQKVTASAQHWGFCLHPVLFEDLIALVESGGILPPKSTWFEPRMKNGLVVKRYE